MRHALPKRLPWRAIALNLGTCLALVGGVALVSTPVLGSWIFGIGAIFLIAATS